MSSASATPQRRRGTLKWLAHKGFGFVDNLIVFPDSALLCNAELRQGDTIEYEVVQGKKGPVAGNILVLVSNRRMGEHVTLTAQFSIAREVELEQKRAKEDAELERAMAKATLKDEASASSPKTAADDLWSRYGASVQRLMFYGWGDLSRLTRPRLSLETLVSGPICTQNLSKDQLPQYTPLRREIGILGSYEKVGEEFKPSILLACFAAMKTAVAKKANSTAADAIAALSAYDIVTSRKQLKALLTLPDTGSLLLYAYRPMANGPLILERGKHYEETPNSVGMQFEKRVMVKSTAAEEFTSVYSLVSGVIGTNCVLLTGELDGVDAKDGSPVEVTTVNNTKAMDATRALERAVQSHLCAVPTAIFAGYDEPASREDPTRFSPEDCRAWRTPELEVSGAAKERAMLRGAAVLSKLRAVITDPAYWHQILVFGQQVIVSRFDSRQDRPVSGQETVVTEDDIQQMANIAAKGKQ